MTESDGPEAQGLAREHSFDEVTPGGAPRDHLTIEDLDDVRLRVTADLGQCSMLVREVLDLARGSIIQLDKLAGEMTELYVNGLVFARGEVVVIGDNLHVRIGEILGAEDKDEAEETFDDYDDEEDY
jgi:flagellar motor switch protein FliN/FliY